MSGLYKRKFNPIPGTSLVPVNTAIRIKDTVPSQINLPLSGNTVGDGRITIDNGHLYVWGIDASSGLLTDWVDQGNFIDIDWSAILNKPSSSVSSIDNIVANSIISIADGNNKKIISMTYNIITGMIIINYET